MNVLVYSGPGATAEAVKHTVESLRLHLSPQYAVIAVPESTIINDPWMFKTAMLVLPGGADLPMGKVLNGAGNKKIKDYVRKGGKFIGFCAGGYYGATRCEFEVGTSMEVSGPRELSFYPGIARGAAYKGFAYETHQGCKCITIQTANGPVKNYYNGGGIFVDADKYPNTKILAKYTDPDLKDSGDAAVVICEVGKGKALLTGSHPEFTPTLMKPASDDYPYLKTLEQMNENPEIDHNRKLFLRDCLKELDLVVNENVDISVPQLTPTYLASLKPEILINLLQELPTHHVDANDTFEFSKMNDSDNEIQLLDNYTDPNNAIKYVKVIQGSLPSHKLTPYFNISTYFNRLKDLWSKNGNKIGEFGTTFGYTEVITSTNTLLDKNPGWLKYLPHGFTMSATVQVSGRGRGGNIWINPKGVLATSVLFKVPVGKVQIITLQYLCGLAVVESIFGYGCNEAGKCVGYEDLPIKLKWPNDIYAMKPEYFQEIGMQPKPAGTVESDEQKYAKISGGLINSQFFDGIFHLVWGVGINVSNVAPATSLNLVLAQLNKLRAEKGLPELPPIQNEVLLAKILYTVEQFYSVFVKSGIKPFLPLYYKRWFHSGQIVDVDINGSNKLTRCEIQGITDDYGLLIVEDIETKQRFELQPDGNSFDIFKGLIYKKS